MTRLELPTSDHWKLIIPEDYKIVLRGLVLKSQHMLFQDSEVLTWNNLHRFIKQLSIPLPSLPWGFPTRLPWTFPNESFNDQWNIFINNALSTALKFWGWEKPTEVNPEGLAIFLDKLTQYRLLMKEDTIRHIAGKVHTIVHKTNPT